MPVVVNGVREFLKAIDEIDEDMYKNVRASLKTPMLKTTFKAKQNLPSNQNVLSGWLKQAEPQEGQRRPFPAYDQAGASLNPNAGIQFIAALPQVEDATMAGSVGRRGRKNKGRVIYKAWKEEQGDAYKGIQKAIDEAIFEYYKKLPLEKKGQVLGFYKERSARGFRGV